MYPSLRFYLIFFTLVLSGCSTYDLAPGRSAGYIVRVYSTAELRKERPSCSENLSDSDLENHKYAEVVFPHGRLRRYVLAVVPDALRLAKHDEVEVASERCTAGVVPEIKRMLGAGHG